MTVLKPVHYLSIQGGPARSCNDFDYLISGEIVHETGFKLIISEEKLHFPVKLLDDH